MLACPVACSNTRHPSHRSGMSTKDDLILDEAVHPVEYGLMPPLAISKQQVLAALTAATPTHQGPGSGEGQDQDGLAGLSMDQALDPYQAAVADVDPAWSAGVSWFTPIAQVRLLQQHLSDAGGNGHHQVVTAPEGWSRDSPRESRESGRNRRPATPRALPRTRSTNACRTPVTTDPIRSFYSLRGRSHDRLARTACGSRSEPPATPALLASPDEVASAFAAARVRMM
jgi:hypothetical protein